jgi:hypothetical protein
VGNAVELHRIVGYRSGIEIACDESGAEGEKLANGQTRLFTHAAVAVSMADAVECVAELRVRIGSPAQEYKANHLLRPKHRRALEWFLGPDGPISGRAWVVLVDKERFLLRTFRTLLSNPDSPGWLAVPEADTGSLDDIRGTCDDAVWRTFCDGVNDLLRGRRPPEELLPVGCWVGCRDAVRAVAARQARENPDRVSVDPLFWAITRAVGVWGGPVAVVHDRHRSLTPIRIAALVAACAPPGGLVRFDLTAARSDARVQLADFLAGIVRRTRTAELEGTGDPVLLDLVQGYVAISV